MQIDFFFMFGALKAFLHFRVRPLFSRIQPALPGTTELPLFCTNICPNSDAIFKTHRFLSHTSVHRKAGSLSRYALLSLLSLSLVSLFTKLPDQTNG